MCARDSLGRLFALGEGIRLVGEPADSQQLVKTAGSWLRTAWVLG